jgi:hypothetical protein
LQGIWPEAAAAAAILELQTERKGKACVKVDRSIAQSRK